VVVLIIHVECVSSFKPENHPPVPAHDDCPRVLPIAFETVKAEPRQLHVVDTSRGVEGGQTHFQFLSVTRSNSGFAARLEVPLQPLMPKRLDHNVIVACCAPRNTLNGDPRIAASDGGLEPTLQIEEDELAGAGVRGHVRRRGGCPATLLRNYAVAILF